MFDRVLAFYTKFFALWVMLLAVAAYFYPGPFMVRPIVMTCFFALTMFGIGAVLSVDDFRRIVHRPVIVVAGSIAQFTIMPLGAYALANVFQLPDAMAAGLILAGCAPGAMSSNVMSYIARADTAYSVSLTTVSTLLCPLVTPALTLWLAGARMPVAFWRMFIEVICMVVLPLGLGFGVRQVLRDKVDRVSRVFPAISVTFIMFICAVVIARNPVGGRGGSAAEPLRDGQRLRCGRIVWDGRCAAANAEHRDRYAERGLGAVLALNHLGEEAAIPAALFVFVCIITASGMAEFWRRSGEAQKTSPVCQSNVQ